MTSHFAVAFLSNIMNEFIFTFGHGQNPGIGYYCKIKAKTKEEAILIMDERTLRWSDCYDSEDKAGVKEFNLKELEWDGMDFIHF